MEKSHSEAKEPRSENKYWVVNLVCLWFSQILVMAGFSALIPFIPLFVTKSLGVTEKTAIGEAVAMFNFFGTLAYAIFCPIWGKLSDRFGVKPMLLRGTFLTSFLFPLMGYVAGISKWAETFLPFMTPVGLLVLLRFFSAACAGTTSASQVMVVRTVPDDRQGFALGMLTTSIWGGTMLGNVIGGLTIHRYGYLPSFWICGILYVFAGVFILFTRDNPVRQNEAAKSSSSVAGHTRRFRQQFTRGVWLMMALFLLMGVMRYLEVPYIALKIKELAGEDMAEYWTGIISAFVCAAAVVSGMVSGWLSDRCRPMTILLPALVLSAVALALQGFASSLVTFAAARSLLYLAAGGLHPVLQKVLTTITPKRKRGSVFGFSSCMTCCGSMLAALIGGWIYSSLTVDSIFYGAAIGQIVALPFLYWLIGLATKRPRSGLHGRIR